MLQPQKSSLLGDLYYSTTPQEYVAPPVEAIKALGKAKESDYLTTMGSLNEMDTVLRSLPKDASPELYNTIKGQYEKVIGGITPDNYSDKMLDVKQFAHDFQNKMGVKELLAQQKLIAEGKETLQKAIDKGEIVGDEMKRDYMTNLMSSVKPLTIDPATGFVTQPSAVDASYNPFYDAQAETLKQIEGWKSNKNIVTDAKGRLTAGPNLPGHLGYQEGEEIKYEDLVNKLSQGLQANPKYMAYAGDVARARTRGAALPTTAEGIKQLIPNSPLTVEQIQEKMDKGLISPESLKALQKQKVIDDYTKGAVQLAAEKGSFRNINQTYVADPFLKRSWEVEDRDLARADKKAELVADTPSVTAESVTGFAPQLDMTLSSSLHSKDKELAGNMTQMYADMNAYAASPNADPATLQDKRVAIHNIRKQREIIANAQKAKQQDLLNRSTKEGVSITKAYNESLPLALNEVMKSNAEKLLTAPDATIDVSSKIKTINGKPSIVINRDGKQINFPLSSTPEIQKVGNSYILNTSYGQETRGGNLINPLDVKDIAFDKRGNVTNKVRTGKGITLDRLPTAQELAREATRSYEEDKSGSVLGETFRAGNVVYPNKIRDITQQLKQKYGDTPLEIQQPLTVISSTGAGAKDPDKNIVNLNKHFTQDFKNNSTNYKVEDASGELTSVSDYMMKNFGIPYSPEYVKDAKALVTTNNSPMNGQYYQGVIELTPAGIKAVKNKNPRALEQGNLKLPMVNPSGSSANADVIRKEILPSYGKIRNDNSAASQNLRIAFGRMYAANSDISNDIDKALVNVSVPNKPVPMPIRGNKYYVTPIAESGTGSDIDSQSYSISGVNNSKELVVLSTNNTGKEVWVTPSTAGTRPIKFASPEELKAYVGSKFLDEEYKNQVQTAQPTSTSTSTSHSTRTTTRFR